MKELHRTMEKKRSSGNMMCILFFAITGYITLLHN